MRLAWAGYELERFLFSKAPKLIFADVSHELRLQALRAKFAADVQRALPGGNPLIPRAQIQDWLVKIHR